MYQRDDILKLSEVGLNHIYKYNPSGRERASQWRFEYRCKAKGYPECLSVLKLPKKYYCSYHETFLEKV